MKCNIKRREGVRRQEVKEKREVEKETTKCNITVSTNEWGKEGF